MYHHRLLIHQHHAGRYTHTHPPNTQRDRSEFPPPLPFRLTTSNRQKTKRERGRPARPGKAARLYIITEVSHTAGSRHQVAAAAAAATAGSSRRAAASKQASKPASKQQRAP